jgi:lysylphosphatidylglycerol synthetase-like protein (DUF2156 family)
MRKAIRIGAIAANVLVLAPHALFVLVVAFSGDYEPWPTAAWGGLYLTAAASAVFALLAHRQGCAQIISAGMCVLLQVVLLVRGLFDFLDKPGMMSWPEHAMLSAPIVLVPLVSLTALALRDRYWPHPLCPNCGYNRTGLTSEICPECGNRQQNGGD